LTQAIEELESRDQWLLETDTLVDHFRIIRPLGKGGMAEVYLARDTKLGRKVALKIVRPEALGSKEAIDRFLFEARATARFAHPHIVTIYAVGEAHGRPYVALEYLEGQSLRERMEQQRCSLAEILRIGLAIAEALKEAHGGDILHRDLKPENVILAKDGRLRVLDFGLAGVSRRKEHGGSEDMLESAILEPAGSKVRGVRGTPAYMAPEQWEEKQSTGAVDIWALGVILYELISGRRPYEETSSVKQAARVLGPYPVPPLDRNTAPGLTDLIMESLSKDPAKRPSAALVVSRLTEILTSDRDVSLLEDSPFRGLLAFDERHRHFFFGRNSEIAAFVERLRQQPVLPVVGPSGAGKSSFVQAGVIPRLRERGPLVVLQMRPGANPFLVLASRIISARRQTPASTGAEISGLELPSSERLDDSIDQALETEADRLALQLKENPQLLNLVLHRLADKKQGRVVLFVDQLEELYTLVSNVSVRRAFMRAICTAADDPEMPVRVIFTIREEFLSRLAEGKDVREAISQISVLRSPEPESLHEILVRPLQAVGYSFDDPKMVWEMVNEVKDEISPLPLLQFAGRMLWDRRDEKERVLRREVYASMGGVAGALAQHADGILAGLSVEDVRLARNILLRLVTGEGTRQVLTRSKLMEGLDGRAEDVLRRLTLARLITIRQSKTEEEGELELVHESLIVTWGRLARWIDESREDLVFLTEVTQAAELWEKRGKRAEEVWQGDALREARKAVDHCTTDVPSQVIRFLDAGQRKENRRTWKIRFGIATAFVGLGVMALVFMAKEHETSLQKEVVEHERAVAQREGASAILMQGNVLEARAKLRASLEVEDSVSGRALWSQLSKDPLVWREDQPEIVHWVTISPDGKTVAASLFGGWIVLIDTRTAGSSRFRAYREGYVTTKFSPDGRYLAYFTEIGQVGIWDIDLHKTRILGHHGKRIYAADISNDGKLIATSGDDKTVQIWNTSTGSARQVGETGEKAIWSVSFGPRSRLLATVSEDGTARIMDLSSASGVRTLDTEGEKVKWARFSRDSEFLVSSSDKGVRTWDLSSGTSKLIPEKVPIEFSRDLKWMATRGKDGLIHVWDVRAESITKTLKNSSNKVTSRAFSSDGRFFAGSGEDDIIQVWNTESGEQILDLEGHRDMVSRLAFSRDGKYMVSGSLDKSVRLWDLTRQARKRERRGHGDQVIGVGFSPDGTRLATGGFDRSVKIWDTNTGKELATLNGHLSTIWRLAYSPDGNWVATAAFDGKVRLWDVTTFSAEKNKILEGHVLPVYSVAFSPDSKLVASGGGDGTVRLWDVATGKQKKKITIETKKRILGSESKSMVSDVCFSPDGKWVVSSVMDKSIRFWDVKTGKLLKKYDTQDFVNALDFNPDGTLLAYGGVDGKLMILDVGSGDVHELGKHWGWIYDLKFHPDGKRIATASRDDTARIWELESGNFVELRGHRSDVNRVAFNPQGKLLATVGDDATVRLWNVNPLGSTVDGGCLWRAPLLYVPTEGQVQLFSHRGWVVPGNETVSPAPADDKWHKAVEAARLASADPKSSTLCLSTLDAHLEFWDTGSDSMVWRKVVDRADRVLATQNGCGVLTKDTARLFTRSGRIVDLGVAATALSWTPEQKELLVATEGHVRIFDPAGKLRKTFPCGKGISALASVDDPVNPGRWIVAGNQEGNIEILSDGSDSAAEKPRVMLRDAPLSPVTVIIGGPSGTLVLGYSSGQVGIWDLRNGSRLEYGKLHGPINHLAYHQSRLFAVSELGDYLVWDLGIYGIPYCELLGRVWSDSLLVWKDGHLIPGSIPADHRCSKNRMLRAQGHGV